MKKKFTSLFFVLFALVVQAQIPQGYYNSANGLTGSELKAALHNIIKGHVEYPYSSSGTDVWDILKEADRDPNHPQNVLCIYSKFSINAAAEYNSADGWNKEHVWAKSRGNFGTSKGAGTDLHHIRAADISTNSARNNRNFDEASTAYYDKGGTYHGQTPSFTSSSKWVWEPPADVKGDVARMLMYMTVRYEGEGDEPDLELQEEYLDAYSKAPAQARLSTLLQWHVADPVDAEERRRNNVVYSYQNNRNPFIDHPEYVNQIFKGTQPSNSAPVFTSTAITSVKENQYYTYNISTYDADGDQMNITASALPSYLQFADYGNGTAVLWGTPAHSNVGSYEITLKVSDGKKESNQKFTLTVMPEGGSGIGNDLFFSEYIEGSSYNKALEIANFTGASIDLSDYTIKKQTNGSGNWSSGLALKGTLSNGDVYVLSHSSASSTIKNQADYVGRVSELNFNGNDPIGLFKKGKLIDIIGNFSAGSSYFAKDKTLQRKASVTSPNITYTISEWNVLSKNTFTGIGSHHVGASKQIAAVVKQGEKKLDKEEHLKVDFALKLYPNPTREYLTVLTHIDKKKELSYRIFDLKGRLLFTQKEFVRAGAFEKKINVANLKAGVYLLQVKGEGVHKTHRFIVE